jgi:hypothetical protein
MWSKFPRRFECPFLSEVYEFAALAFERSPPSSTMVSNFVLNLLAVIALVTASLLISISKYLFDRQTRGQVPHSANIANMAGVQAVSLTTERNTSECEPLNRQ